MGPLINTTRMNKQKISDLKIVSFQQQMKANCAEIHRCFGLVFSYYIQETDGELDILFTAYIHSATVITD